MQFMYKLKDIFKMFCRRAIVAIGNYCSLRIYGLAVECFRQEVGTLLRAAVYRCTVDIYYVCIGVKSAFMRTTKSTLQIT
jgi:hypothetical protein